MATFSVIDSAMKLLRNSVYGWKERIGWPIESTPNLQLLIAGVAVVLAAVIGLGTAMALAPGTNEFSGLGVDISQRSRLNNEAEKVDIKCPECGVVVSRRMIGHVDNTSIPRPVDHITGRQTAPAARTYEVTLRMKDGSTHQFMDANPENWRPGERVILIGRASTSSD